jgi:hypothetical protein
MTMRSWIQVLETASCINAGEGCVHETQSDRTLRKRKLDAPGCPFLAYNQLNEYLFQ